MVDTINGEIISISIIVAGTTILISISLVMNHIGPANSFVIMGLPTARSIELFSTVFLSHAIAAAG